MMSGVLTLQEYLLLNGADVDAKFSQIKADVRYFLEFCFCRADVDAKFSQIKADVRYFLEFCFCRYHCSRFS